MMEMWIIDLGVANQAFNIAPLDKNHRLVELFHTLDLQTEHAKLNVLVSSEHSTTLTVELHRSQCAH